MIDPTFLRPHNFGASEQTPMLYSDLSAFPSQNVVPELEREAREAKLEALKRKRQAVEERQQGEREAQKKLRQIGFRCMEISIDQARNSLMPSKASPPRRTSRSEGLAQPVTQKSAAIKRAMQRLRMLRLATAAASPLTQNAPSARRIAIACAF